MGYRVSEFRMHKLTGALQDAYVCTRGNVLAAFVRDARDAIANKHNLLLMPMHREGGLRGRRDCPPLSSFLRPGPLQ